MLQFHGVPDNEHSWVHTPPERFKEYMEYLREQGCRVIALRDLAKYVDPDYWPKDPLAIIQKRQQEMAPGK